MPWYLIAKDPDDTAIVGPYDTEEEAIKKIPKDREMVCHELSKEIVEMLVDHKIATEERVE